MAKESGSGGDEQTTLAELKAEVLAFARERDWEQFHSPKNLSMALAAEAGELMEHFLWLESEASRERARREDVADELADILLYALEFANVTEIDLARAMRNKMVKNGVKYPVEKSRGNSLKYTELEPENNDA
jgi:NTP pyrophosphatase (non-canonical NTP hydrolase)